MPAFRLYLDSNIFIYAFENNDALAKKLLQLIALNEGALNEGRRSHFLATSEIVLAELIVDPLKKKNKQLIELYDTISIDNALFVVGTISREVLWHAAQLRSEHIHLRLPDAIHLSTAMHLGCARFLTADTRLKEAYSIGPNQLIPEPLTARISIVRPEMAVLDEILAEIQQ